MSEKFESPAVDAYEYVYERMEKAFVDVKKHFHNTYLPRAYIIDVITQCVLIELIQIYEEGSLHSREKDSFKLVLKKIKELLDLFNMRARIVFADEAVEKASKSP